MSNKVVFLHTVASLAAMFDKLAKDTLPNDTEIVHLVDEMLLKDVLRNGSLTPFVYQRVTDHAVAVEKFGASLLQLTCSSISPCADVALTMVKIPVLKIDEPMVDLAIQSGKKIGVAATAITTLRPTTELIGTRAKYFNKDVVVDPRLCEGAYDALFKGDIARHDAIVQDTIKTLMQSNDVIILAQASMARVAALIPENERLVPILSSPDLAVQRVKTILQG